MVLDSSWEDFGCWTQRAVVPRTSNGDVASECLEPGSECKVEDHLLALSVSSGPPGTSGAIDSASSVSRIKPEPWWYIPVQSSWR